MIGSTGNTPIRQSLAGAQTLDHEFMDLQRQRLIPNTDQDVPCVPTLLDKAQRTRQMLLDALRMLNSVLNDKECNDVGIERGIDPPHDSLTQEIELAQMLVGGLSDRIGDLQRRVGQL